MGQCRFWPVSGKIVGFPFKVVEVGKSPISMLGAWTTDDLVEGGTFVQHAAPDFATA
jgi:hypothetical protein